MTDQRVCVSAEARLSFCVLVNRCSVCETMQLLDFYVRLKTTNRSGRACASN